MVDAFGGSRNSIKPPERGVFALDHDKECQPRMKDYLKCLRENEADHIHCRVLAKEYLACRMARGLMKEEDFNRLGFYTENGVLVDMKDRVDTLDGPSTKETKGFIGGTGVKTANKWKFW